jgi:hypothetical protein
MTREETASWTAAFKDGREDGEGTSGEADVTRTTTTCEFEYQGEEATGRKERKDAEEAPYAHSWTLGSGNRLIRAREVGTSMLLVCMKAGKARRATVHVFDQAPYKTLWCWKKIYGLVAMPLPLPILLPQVAFLGVEDSGRSPQLRRDRHWMNEKK